MKCFHFYPALLLLAISSHAQDSTSLAFYKHDVGFNTSFILSGIFDSDNNAPVDLLFKQQKSATYANRLGISLGYHTLNGSVVSGFQIDEIRLNLALAVGKEWQQVLSSHWLWYGGGDAIPQFRYFSQYAESDNIPIRNNSSTTFGVSARPFLGIRFQINDRLYVSTEASLSLGFNLHRGKDIVYRDDNGDGNMEEEKNDIDSFETFIQATPASGIYLFYSF